MKVSDIKNKFLRDVKPKLNFKDIIGFTFVIDKYISYNEQDMHGVMKYMREGLKYGNFYLLQENNKTLSIDGIKHHILVIQGCGINNSLIGYIFDDLFLVDGMIFVFKSERIRDSIFNWLIKFCQVKNYNGDSDCNICFEDNDYTLFTKCCNKEICASCLSSKESNSCPFCRKEY
jgi:hypothetical protein